MTDATEISLRPFTERIERGEHMTCAAWRLSHAADIPLFYAWRILRREVRSPDSGRASLGWAPKRKVSPPGSVVYFVHAEAARLTKIGVTTVLEMRLNDLRASSPVPLTLLLTIPGERELEDNIHRCLFRLRSHGEWFRHEPELAAFIEMLRGSVAASAAA